MDFSSIPEPTPRFDAMMAEFSTTASTHEEKDLLALFEKHSADVSEHYEACVPALDGSDVWGYRPTEGFPLNQFHGPIFHKGFRQTEVVGADRAADLDAWRLLASGKVPAFWSAHAESMRTDR